MLVDNNLQKIIGREMEKKLLVLWVCLHKDIGGRYVSIYRVHQVWIIWTARSFGILINQLFVIVVAT